MKTQLVSAIGDVAVHFVEHGSGRDVLLLHGGGGPQTVEDFGVLLAESLDAHVVVPTHPGFAGTPRPERLHTIAGLAEVYVGLLDQLDLVDVMVVGNSIGGWIAAEMALVGSPRIGSVVLVDAVGIEVATHPVADFFSLTFPEIAELTCRRWWSGVSAIASSIATTAARMRTPSPAHSSNCCPTPATFPNWKVPTGWRRRCRASAVLRTRRVQQYGGLVVTAVATRRKRLRRR